MKKNEEIEKERLLPFAAEPGWLPVGLFTNRGEYYAPCDLYVRTGPGRYVLFARREQACDDFFRQKLTILAAKCLYIRDIDAEIYFRYVKKILGHLIESPYEDSLHKAMAVYSSCQEIMRQIFADPRGSFLHCAREIIDSTVELIATDPAATRCLTQITAYDRSSYTHSTNVGIFGVALASSYLGRRAEQDLLALGSALFLHDIGRTHLSKDILDKPGPLSPEERQAVNRHPQIGCELLSEQGMMTDTMELITRRHHEKDDGSGYPDGLTAKEIHPYVRICRLVDAYEALTSNRTYERRRPTFAALKFMKERVVTDNDQKVFEHLVRLFLS